jgi:hypothetical protein
MKLTSIILLLLLTSSTGLNAASITKFAIQPQYLTDANTIRGSGPHRVGFKANITITRSLKSYGFEKLRWTLDIANEDEQTLSDYIQITEANFPSNLSSVDLTVDCSSIGTDKGVRVRVFNQGEIGGPPVSQDSILIYSTKAFNVIPPPLNPNPSVNLPDVHLFAAYSQTADFRQIDYITGGSLKFGLSEWANVQGMTSLNGYLYVVQANNLHRINPTDGSWVILGQQGIWPGTEGVASSSNGYIYIVQNSRIHKVNPTTGQFTIIGNPEWANTDCLTTYNGFIYIVENNHLYKVNENTGSYSELNIDLWGGAKGIASSNDGYIWIIQAGNLHKVNATSGEWTMGTQGDWNNSQKGCLTYYNGGLYALRNNSLLVKINVEWLSYDAISSKSVAGNSFLTAI